MTIKEASSIFHLEEREDPLVLWYREGAFKIPEAVKEKRKKVYELIERKEYDLKGKLPEGVESIRVVFSKGVLYQIRIRYTKNYFRKVSWNLFISPAVKKYGRPSGRSRVNSDIHQSLAYHWLDEKTELEIKKTDNFTKEAVFINTTYDVFYTDTATNNFVSKLMNTLAVTEVTNE